MDIRISGMEGDSIVDGPGLRFSLFTQGCPHHCKGCHNPQTHDYNGGYVISTGDIFDKIISCKMIKGVTFSGGEPFTQVKPLLELARRIRKETKLDLIIYTGFTFEQLMERGDADTEELISLATFIVDGRFEIGKRDLTLLYRGSSNQRILDGKKSVERRTACPYVIEELPSFDIEI